jgi:hypothetical protein
VRALSPQIPSALVVDCDFLNVGLSGLVPERDALGFLDLLLYGSSLGVITQESQGGVKTIGAGSFPVTKRMPFVLSAFDEAAHRLVHHSRCAVFVGPLDEDEGGLHPLCGAVDIPVLVRELDAVRPGAVDPIEEQIASEWDSELLSVRLVGAAAIPDQMFAELLGDDDDDAPIAPAPRAAQTTPPPPPVSPPPPALPPRVPGPEASTPSLSDLADPPSEPPRPAARPTPPASPATFGTPPPPARRRSRGGTVVGVLLVLAVVIVGGRWIILDRSQKPDGGATASKTVTPETTPPDTATARRDTATSMENAGAPGTAEPPVGNEPRRAELADTGGRSGGTVLINPEDIHVIAEIAANWPDQFFIHISSFRKSVEARNEVAFLENHEFPVFIVFLDLDAKGKWYRVYAGPFKTRDEAREVKKSLDDIPTVRFTRITKIEE